MKANSLHVLSQLDKSSRNNAFIGSVYHWVATINWMRGKDKRHGALWLLCYNVHKKKKRNKKRKNMKKQGVHSRFHELSTETRRPFSFCTSVLPAGAFLYYTAERRLTSNTAIILYTRCGCTEESGSVCY